MKSTLLPLYQWGRCLPFPIRKIVHPVTEFFFLRKGRPLAGPLVGYRMITNHLSYIEGKYEPDLCTLLINLVQPDWVCVDVGAYVGYFSLLLSKLVGKQGGVIAFEAHGPTAEILKKNVSLNLNNGQVQIINLAISDGEHNSVQLSLQGSCFGIVGNGLSDGAGPEWQIKSTSLDRYFGQQFTPIHFVKIDVEGAEASVLQGMQRILANQRPILLIEFHHERGWEGRHELLKADYALYNIHKKSWLHLTHDFSRPYHCLAVPSEQANRINAQLRLASTGLEEV